MAKGRKDEDEPGTKTIVRNRRALHDYFVERRVEAGLELLGSEVKSLREGGANLTDAYAMPEGGEIFLVHCNIAPWKAAGPYLNHLPLRRRRLLLHRREIEDLSRNVAEKGLTLIPLALYFKGGRAKAEIGLCKGKAQRDKRDSIQEREQRREIDREMSRRRRR